MVIRFRDPGIWPQPYADITLCYCEDEDEGEVILKD